MLDKFISQSFDLSSLKSIDLHKDKASRKSKSIVLSSSALSGQDSISLDVNCWLPAAAEQLNISRDIRDYVLQPAIVNVSGLPNTNGDSFSTQEWLKFRPKFGMQAYRTFKGKPVFREHCFPAKTLITTKSGYKHISKIKVGDLVLTHTGNYQKVLKTFDNGVKPLSHVVVQGYGTLPVTENHPLWIVDRRQIFGQVDSCDPKQARKWRLKRHNITEVTPHFRPVSDVYTGDYLVVPIYVGGSHTVHPDLAFLTGLFAAEGSFEKYHDEYVATYLTLGHNEDDLISKTIDCLENLGYQYSVRMKPKRGTCTFRISGRELASFMFGAVGEYSHLKRLKSVRSWDDESLKNFLGGYISGDGSVDCVDKRNGRIRSVTVSKMLALDIQNIWARLGLGATITVSDKFREMRTSYTRTNGELVHYVYDLKNPVYHVGVSPRNALFLNEYLVGKTIKRKHRYYKRDSSRMIVMSDKLLSPVLTIKHAVESARVYNFEVEEDNSYVAGGFVVHNCNQDHRISQGVIFDSNIARLTKFNGNRTRVMLLLAVDRNLRPDLAQKLLDGNHNTWSMGVYYTSYVCSVCGNSFNGKSRTFCSHTRINRPTYRIKDILAYRRCMDLEGFETSEVADPAFVCAAGGAPIDMRKA